MSSTTEMQQKEPRDYSPFLRNETHRRVSSYGEIQMLPKQTESITLVLRDIKVSFTRYKGSGGFVATTAEIGQNAKIHSKSIVSAHAKLGGNVEIGENVLVGRNVIIPNNTKIPNNSIIWDGVELGNDVYLGEGVIIVSGKKVPSRTTIPSHKVLS